MKGEGLSTNASQSIWIFLYVCLGRVNIHTLIGAKILLMKAMSCNRAESAMERGVNRPCFTRACFTYVTF